MPHRTPDNGRSGASTRGWRRWRRSTPAHDRTPCRAATPVRDGHLLLRGESYEHCRRSGPGVTSPSRVGRCSILPQARDEPCFGYDAPQRVSHRNSPATGKHTVSGGHCGQLAARVGFLILKQIDALICAAKTQAQAVPSVSVLQLSGFKEHSRHVLALHKAPAQSSRVAQPCSFAQRWQLPPQSTSVQVGPGSSAAVETQIPLWQAPPSQGVPVAFGLHVPLLQRFLPFFFLQSPF